MHPSSTPLTELRINTYAVSYTHLDVYKRQVLETPTKREDITLDEAVHMIDTLTLKRCSHPTLGKKSF